MIDDVERLYRHDRLDRLAPPDRRMHRAQVLAAQVMRLAEPYLCTHEGRAHRNFYEELMQMFWNGGFDVLTDADRAEAGLPIRDRSGWTADELRALEQARLSAMMKPIFVEKK